MIPDQTNSSSSKIIKIKNKKNDNINNQLHKKENYFVMPDKKNILNTLEKNIEFLFIVGLKLLGTRFVFFLLYRFFIVICNYTNYRENYHIFPYTYFCKNYDNFLLYIDIFVRDLLIFTCILIILFVTIYGLIYH